MFLATNEMGFVLQECIATIEMINDGDASVSGFWPIRYDS